jgi:serine/threonine protein phosphatase 1
MNLYAFSSRWEAAPRALPGGMLLAVGDVHGHLDHLDALLDLLRPEILRARVAGLACELVLLGDYVDRGPDSLGTLRRLLGLEALLGVPVHALCGNHDQYLIDFLLAERPDPAKLSTWVGNGGLTTLAELGIRRAEVGNREPTELAARARAMAGPELLRLLGRITTARAKGSYVCVHAGIRPGRALDRQERHELITLREPFLGGKGWDHPFTAIHGHTIRGPEVLGHRIAVDSGTYRTGVLSAVQIEGERLRFLNVTSEPKLKAFKRLPGLSQRRRFEAPEPITVGRQLAFALGA